MVNRMSNIFDEIFGSEQFREEFCVAETQAKLSNIMEDKGISRAELARRLNVSRARISQIFSDDANNFTLRLLVRSFLALGEEPVVVPRSEYEALQSKSEVVDSVAKGTKGADGLAETLIANLLRANLGRDEAHLERSQKRTSNVKDWVTPPTNVLPFVRAHG